MGAVPLQTEPILFIVFLLCWVWWSLTPGRQLAHILGENKKFKEACSAIRLPVKGNNQDNNILSLSYGWVIFKSLSFGWFNILLSYRFQVYIILNQHPFALFIQHPSSFGLLKKKKKHLRMISIILCNISPTYTTSFHRGNNMF